MSAVADDGPVLLTWEEYVKFEAVYEGRRHELVRGTDLTERLYAYQSLPSIEVILFVDHAQRHVTIHRRTGNGWTESRAGAGVSRLTGEVAIDWTAVWADVDADATTD